MICWNCGGADGQMSEKSSMFFPPIVHLRHNRLILVVVQGGGKQCGGLQLQSTGAMDVTFMFIAQNHKNTTANCKQYPGIKTTLGSLQPCVQTQHKDRSKVQRMVNLTVARLSTGNKGSCAQSGLQHCSLHSYLCCGHASVVIFELVLSFEKAQKLKDPSLCVYVFSLGQEFVLVLWDCSGRFVLLTVNHVSAHLRPCHGVRQERCNEYFLPGVIQ